MKKWLQHRPSYLFLVAGDDRLTVEDPRRFARTWVGLLGLALGWGLAVIGLWHAGRWLFGQPVGLYLMPTIIVVAVMLLWPFRRAATALVQLVAGPEMTTRAVVAAVVVLLLTAGLLGVQPHWHRQEPWLPGWLVWIRPESKIDRILLLMPLWGMWSMMILPKFCRPGANSPVLSAMTRGCGPLTAAAVMGLLLIVSIGYCAYLPWTQLAIPGAGILTAIVGGRVLAWRNGRLDRGVLLATNLLTQIVVLLAFVAVHNFRRW